MKTICSATPGAILQQPGGFASLELRRWKDNTGRHSCRGRLIRVIDGKAQLLKDNGRTSTVAFGRLSPRRPGVRLSPSQRSTHRNAEQDGPSRIEPLVAASRSDCKKSNSRRATSRRLFLLPR